jgi:hypothetical protein
MTLRRVAHVISTASTNARDPCGGLSLVTCPRGTGSLRVRGCGARFSAAPTFPSSASPGLTRGLTRGSSLSAARLGGRIKSGHDAAESGALTLHCIRKCARSMWGLIAIYMPARPRIAPRPGMWRAVQLGAHLSVIRVPVPGLDPGIDPRIQSLRRSVGWPDQVRP